MSARAKADVLLAGPAATAEALVLAAPISLWGGVDPKSGTIIDVRHPDAAKSVAGKILFLPATIGSSSASAVMLELVYAGHAPAAVIFHEPDAIAVLGLVVAREMGWPVPIALRLDRTHFEAFGSQTVAVSGSGDIRTV